MKATRRVRSGRRAVALAAGGALLVGCEGGQPSAAGSPTVAARAAESTATTNATARPRGSSVIGGRAPCENALRVAALHQDAGVGQRDATYTLTNDGLARCAVHGHPRVVLRDSAGRPVAGVTIDTSRRGVPPADTLAALAPGAQAVFSLRYVGIPADGRPCVESRTIAITPPGATQRTTLPARFTICATRTVHVQAVAGGTTAAAGAYRDTLPAADAAGRVVTLQLNSDSSATLTTEFVGRPSALGASRRGRWTVRDTVLDVQFSAGAPLRWVTRDGRLVPLNWDRARYGSAGLPLRRVY